MEGVPEEQEEIARKTRRTTTLAPLPPDYFQQLAKQQYAKQKQQKEKARRALSTVMTSRGEQQQQQVEEEEEEEEEDVTMAGEESPAMVVTPLTSQEAERRRRAQREIPLTEQQAAREVLGICDPNAGEPEPPQFERLKRLGLRFGVEDADSYVSPLSLCERLRERFGVQGLQLPEYVLVYALELSPTDLVRRVGAVNHQYLAASEYVLKRRLFQALKYLMERYAAAAAASAAGEEEGGEPRTHSTDTTPFVDFERYYRAWKAREDKDAPAGMEYLLKAARETLWHPTVLESRQSVVTGALLQVVQAKSTTCFSYVEQRQGTGGAPAVSGWVYCHLPRPLVVEHLLRSGMHPNLNERVALQFAVGLHDVDLVRLCLDLGASLTPMWANLEWCQRSELPRARAGEPSRPALQPPLCLLIKSVLRPSSGLSEVPPTQGHRLASIKTLARLLILRGSARRRKLPPGSRETSSQRQDQPDQTDPHGNTALHHLLAPPEFYFAHTRRTQLENAYPSLFAALDGILQSGGPDDFDLNARNLEGDTALHVVTPEPHSVQCALHLLGYRPRLAQQLGDWIPPPPELAVDAPNALQRTPLFAAAAAGSALLVERLKQLGADPEARDALGANAFLYALRDAPSSDASPEAPQAEAVQRLLQRYNLLEGLLDPRAKDNLGMSALSFVYRWTLTYWQATLNVSRGGSLRTRTLHGADLPAIHKAADFFRTAHLKYKTELPLGF